MRLLPIALRSAVLVALLPACTDDRPPDQRPPDQRPEPATTAVRKVLRLRPVTPPADAGQLRGCKYPRVVRGADGGVYVSWIRALSRRRHALEFARFDGAAFSEIRTVAEGEDWFVNWADFPSLTAARDGTLAAHWLERNGKGTYSYGIRVACSTDTGATWHAPFWLHEDRQPAEHGFATIVPAGDGGGGGTGSFQAVWLDGRDLAKKGTMTLRTRRFDANGPLSEDVQLDDRVCECCATDAGFSGGNLIAVYRDSTAAGVRDISFVRRAGGKWTAAAPCAADGWQNPG